MSARQELLSLFEEWSLLSDLEGEAIVHGAWPKVEKCQSAKRTLREKIDCAKAALNQEKEKEVAGTQAGEIGTRQEIERMAAQLVALEQRNQELLFKRRAQMEVEREELGSSSRRLRQVHRAFSVGERSVWQSYS